MKIAIFTQLFWPEKSAASNRLMRITRFFCDKNSVTIFAGIPSYPRGIIYDGYYSRWKQVEQISDNVKIIRNWSILSENKGFFKRLLGYLSFSFSSFINSLFEIKKPDIIIASSPHIFNALVALAVAKIKKARFYLDIRDLWPDSLVVMGIIKSKTILSLLYKFENLLYRKAEKIFVVTEGLSWQLIDKGVPAKKIEILTNAVDTQFFQPYQKDRKDLNLPERETIVLYAGNHSRAQNIRALYDLVENFAPKGNQFTFLFIGEGEEKEYIEKRAKTVNRAHVIFMDQMNQEKLRDYINASDICLVSLLNNRIFYAALPTKTLEFMACAKPVIFLADNFFAETIEIKKIGFQNSDYNQENFNKILSDLGQNINLRKKVGDEARKYVTENYTQEKFNNTLSNIFNQA